MKKILLLVVVLVGALIAVNYARTGQIALFSSSMSAEEKELHDLEAELAQVNAQMSQAGRTASVTGMDTTADVSALMHKKEQLEAKIAAARLKIKP